MTRGTHSRGQTEPLAALVAVAAVCLAVGLYAGYVTDVLPGSTDRTVDESVADQVWTQIGDAGHYEAGMDVPGAIDEDRLPYGYWVEVNVTYQDSDYQFQQESVAFDPEGNTHDDYGSDYEPPEDADEYTRPIPVRIGEGQVHGGRLTVRVWST